MKKISIILQILFIVFAIQGCNFLSAAGYDSQGLPVKKAAGNLTLISTNDKENVNHKEWDILLKKYVDKDGNVDYKGFLNDKSTLENYLDHLAQNPPSNSWNVQELLAYYINLYNAHTVNLILDNYPVASIKDLNGPWTRSFVKVGNEDLSLGGIENSILRKMNEPRIHFAINCASYSCPNLLNEAFVASKIEQQLEKATLSFINGTKNDISNSSPKLSKIFKWYKKDFTVNGKKDLIAYINQYSTVKINSDATVGFKEYNWSLNEKK